MKNAAGKPLGGVKFKQASLHGGGAVTQLSIALDGSSMICATDVFVPFIRTTGDWDPIIKTSNTPSGLPTTYGGNGCMAVGVAPNDGTCFYFNYKGKLLKRQGSTITITAVPQSVMEGNAINRGMKLAIDPQNKNAFLFGTQMDGVYGSTDGGATVTHFAQESGAPTGTNYSHLAVCDPSSTVTTGVKQRWMHAAMGKGIYLYTAGPTSTPTLMSGSPATVTALTIGPDGKAWACSGGTVYTQSGAGSWTAVSALSGFSAQVVAVHPTNANKVVVLADGSDMRTSYDGGSTWIVNGGTAHITHGVHVGWIDRLDGFATGMPQWHPTANEIWCSTGLGVLKCTPPTVNYADVHWYEQQRGIEELIGTGGVYPPGGPFILSAWDKPFWRYPNGNDGRLPRFSNPVNDLGINHGWDINYAPEDPNFLTGVCGIFGQQLGYSTDRGVTWQAFSGTNPTGTGLGGCVAIVSKQIIYWFPFNNGRAFYTLNGGTSFNYLTEIPGMITTGGVGSSGWGFANYLCRKIAYVDKVTKHLYAYNQGTSVASSTLGIWKRDFSTGTWSQITTTKITPNDSYYMKFRPVPGQAGHAFMVGGDDFSDPIKRTTDGWATSSTLSTITGVMDIGFGPPANTGGYPSIWFWGTYGGVKGFYKSDDNLATAPVLLSTTLGESVDSLAGIICDPDNYGHGYIATGNSSAVEFSYDYTLKLAA